MRSARQEGRGARGAQRAARGERCEGCAARGKRGEAQGVCSARQEGCEARGKRREGCAAQAAEAHGATIRCTVVGCPVLGAAFLLPRSALLTPRCGLNPLHCGAVVASRRVRRRAGHRRPVLIPFIAGQWSLRSGDAARQRHAPRGRSRAAPLSLSPSLRGSGRFRAPSGARSSTRSRRLNPLHCGAVVASKEEAVKNNREPRLNPLHCGAVVASPRPRIPPPNVILCLNPLHCGAVVASHPLVWVQGRTENMCDVHFWQHQNAMAGRFGTRSCQCGA